MRRAVTGLKRLLLIATAIFSFNASAYDDDKKKEICRQPKVQEFTLPEYSANNQKEAQPESEFTFVVSGWANPKKFKLMGKGKSIPFTVQSTETYHKVKAKLLPEFTGETVRISARIPAILECYSTIGWLVKVADKPKGEAPKPDAPAPTTAAESAAPAQQENVPAPKAPKENVPALKAPAAPAPATPAAPPAPTDKPAATQ